MTVVEGLWRLLTHVIILMWNYLRMDEALRLQT